jgi:hypothetical protein
VVEGFQETGGEWTWLARPDDAAVERHHGDYFRRCACQETLIRRENVIPRERALFVRNSELIRDFEDHRASDSIQRAIAN